MDALDKIFELVKSLIALSDNSLGNNDKYICGVLGILPTPVLEPKEFSNLCKILTPFEQDNKWGITQAYISQLLNKQHGGPYVIEGFTKPISLHLEDANTLNVVIEGEVNRLYIGSPSYVYDPNCPYIISDIVRTQPREIKLIVKGKTDLFQLIGSDCNFHFEQTVGQIALGVRSGGVGGADFWSAEHSFIKVSRDVQTLTIISASDCDLIIEGQLHNYFTNLTGSNNIYAKEPIHFIDELYNHAGSIIIAGELFYSSNKRR